MTTREILIESSCYIPTLSSYLGRKESKIFESQVSKSSVLLFHWLQGRSTHSTTDIIELACEEKEDWVVYEILRNRNNMDWIFKKKIAGILEFHKRTELIKFLGVKSPPRKRKTILLAC